MYNQFTNAENVHPGHPSVHYDHSYQNVIEKKAVENTNADMNSNTKKRSWLTTTQYKALEKEFAKGENIHILRRDDLAAELALSSDQVRMWFRNRRARERKNLNGKIDRRKTTSNTTNGKIQPKIVNKSSTTFQPEAVNNESIEISQPPENFHQSNRSLFGNLSHLMDGMNVLEPINNCGNWDHDFSCCCSKSTKLNFQPLDTPYNSVPLPCTTPSFDCEYDFFRDYS